MSSKAAAALTSDFLEETLTVRGVTYRLRELSIGEYDDLVKKATITRTNALGEESETIDNSVLLKMMVNKCLVDPKLTPEQQSRLPMRVMLKLNTTVNRMHYGDEPEEKTPEPADDAEGAAEGNA